MANTGKAVLSNETEKPLMILTAGPVVEELAISSTGLYFFEV